MALSCISCDRSFSDGMAMLRHHGASHPDRWQDRLWHYVDIRGDDECWPWEGPTVHKYGYGKMRVGGEREFCHRLAYISENGDVDGHVLHKCDNPPCCNPGHLYEGTQRDNMSDMDARGRRKNIRGSEMSNAKLTEDEVVEIRERYASDKTPQVVLAEEYGVVQPKISEIVRGVAWPHAGGPTK